MTQTLAGFVQWDDLVNNSTRETVSLIGELSPSSRTFTRTLREYPKLTSATPDFTVFVHNYLDAENHIIEGSVDKPKLDAIFNVMTWMTTSSRNGVITTNTSKFLRDITHAFTSQGYEFGCGDMLNERVGNIAIVCPAWISIKKGNDWEAKFWFCDEYFQRRVGGYPYYEYVHIPPVKPIDVLTGTIDQVKPVIDALTNKVYQGRVNQAITDNGRATTIHVHSLTWYQLTNNKIRLEDVSWTTIIYGVAGDNIESINASLSKYILDNSTHDEGDWTIIHPDLFIKDEYIIVPLWDKVAIGKDLQGAEILSSMIKPGDLTKKNKYFSNMTNEWVNDKVCSFPTLWQSGTCLAVGGLRNKLFSPDFGEQYKDYVLAVTGTSDFDRMSNRTREMKIAIETVLPAANTWKEGVALPAGINVMVRGVNTYLSTTVNKITFNVLVRSSMI